MPLAFTNLQPKNDALKNKYSNKDILGSLMNAFSPNITKENVSSALSAAFSRGNPQQKQSVSSVSAPPLNMTPKSAVQSTPQVPLSQPKSQVNTAPPVQPIANYTVSVPSQDSKKDKKKKSKESVAQAEPTPTYGGLVQQLLKQVQTGQGFIDKTQEDLQNFRSQMAGKYADIESTPIPLEFQQGRIGALQRAAATQEQALQQRVENALTARQQDIGALSTAIGAATPVQVPYGTQFISPLSGTSVLGSGGSQVPNQSALTYAQEVISGTRTYKDAVDAMKLYGDAGKQFLDQAIRQQNPNFDFSRAEAFGSTPGQVKAATDFANVALQNVETILNTLPTLQSSGVPLVNYIGKRFSELSGLGLKEVQEYIGAIQSLRNAYAAALATSKGGTPTDYSSQVNAEIPEWPTPQQIAAIKANLQTLGQARVDIFGTPGSTNQFPNSFAEQW